MNATMEAASKPLADMLARRPVPEVGVFFGVPADAYLAWDAASNSGLSLINRSPAHFADAMRHPPEPTDPQDIGRAVHFAVLEPDLLEDHYIAGPDGPWNRNPYKAARDELAAANPGKVILKPAGFDNLRRLRDSTYADPDARRLLNTPHREVSLVWDETVDVAGHSATVRCKARIDDLNEDEPGTVEIKSTRDCRERPFARDAHKFGYHRQGAWYHRAVRHFPQDFMMLQERHFIIAVEPGALNTFQTEQRYLFPLMVYEITDGALEAGRLETDSLLRTLAGCRVMDTWPLASRDYPRGIRPLTLPDYAWDDTLEAIKENGNGDV